MLIEVIPPSVYRRSVLVMGSRFLIFRRLSRRALGNTAKSALRDWRLGQALFELINGDNNLTTIAMNHGYASLSHFSNEVKEVIGVSPRNLKKLLQAS